jgi:hypothetical protein
MRIWSGGIASNSLILVSFMLLPPYPWGEIPWYALDMRLDRLQSQLEQWKIEKYSTTDGP